MTCRVDLFENVVHARQCFCLSPSSLAIRQPFPRLQPVDAGGFFDDRARSCGFESEICPMAQAVDKWRSCRAEAAPCKIVLGCRENGRVARRWMRYSLSPERNRYARVDREPRPRLNG